MKRLSLALLALSLAATPALAQSGDRKPAKPVPAAPAAKPVKTLDIEAIDVNGDRVVGQLSPISVSKFATSSSLIRIRRDFIDLIVKSGNEI